MCTWTDKAKNAMACNETDAMGQKERREKNRSHRKFTEIDTEKRENKLACPEFVAHSKNRLHRKSDSQNKRQGATLGQTAAMTERHAWKIALHLGMQNTRKESWRAQNSWQPARTCRNKGETSKERDRKQKRVLCNGKQCWNTWESWIFGSPLNAFLLHHAGQGRKCKPGPAWNSFLLLAVKKAAWVAPEPRRTRRERFPLQRGKCWQPRHARPPRQEKMPSHVGKCPKVGSGMGGFFAGAPNGHGGSHTPHEKKMQGRQAKCQNAFWLESLFFERWLDKIKFAPYCGPDSKVATATCPARIWPWHRSLKTKNRKAKE